MGVKLLGVSFLGTSFEGAATSLIVVTALTARGLYFNHFVGEDSRAVETILPILQEYHLLGMFLMLLACGFGFPLPEDVVLIAGGFLAQQEKGALWPSIVVAYFGVLMGDSVMYFIGRKVGTRLLDSKRLHFFFPPKRRAKVEKVFQKWGAYAVLIGRFAAGVRAAVFLTAGAMKVPYRLFFVCDTIAAMASVPLFLWVGYKFSEHLDEVFGFLKQAKLYLLAVGAVALLIYVIYRLIKKRSGGTKVSTDVV